MTIVQFSYRERFCFVSLISERFWRNGFVPFMIVLYKGGSLVI
nr:MAG TPA: hypothetical protein [Caudoviricetes sp.]